MKMRMIRRTLLGLLLLVSLALLVWGTWPGVERAKEQTLTRSEMQVSTPSGEPGTQPPAVLEERLLTLEWPSTLRQGDENSYIRLTLVVAESGEITPTVSAEGNESSEEPVQIPNVYDSHNVMAEARLDMAGLAVAPDDLISVSLRPGETVIFRWNVRATEIGTYRGTVWLYLRYLPLDGGAESRDALKVMDIQVRTVNFLGIGGPAARMMGVLGVIVCGLFGFGDLISGVRWLRKRLRRKEQHDAN
jgi:hypothetical protein